MHRLSVATDVLTTTSVSTASPAIAPRIEQQFPAFAGPFLLGKHDTQKTCKKKEHKHNTPQTKSTHDRTNTKSYETNRHK